MCLEAVKMYGNKPIKLFIRININKEINGIVLPTDEWGPSSILNSSWSFLQILKVNKKNLLGVTQNIGVKIIKIINDLIQFKDTKIIDEGSNTENKLVIIIFNLYGRFRHH